MQWCKIEVDTCVLLKEGKTEWKSNVFTLKFLSVQQNDSGTYHCRAKVDNFSSESHGIKVIVEGRTLYYEGALKRATLFKNQRKSHACWTIASPNVSVWWHSCAGTYHLLHASILPLGTGERKEQNEQITRGSGTEKQSCQHQIAISGLFDNKKNIN